MNLWRPTADEFSNRLRGVQTAPIGEKPIGTDRKPIGTDGKPIGTDRDALVRDYLLDHASASASELASVLGLGPDRTRAVLREMASRGVIVKMSDKRYARYTLPKDKAEEA